MLPLRKLLLPITNSPWLRAKSGPIRDSISILGTGVQIRGGILDCGSPSPSEKAHLPLPSAAGGVLLARLHAEEPPVSALPDADIPIVDPSHLYLGVNAWRCQSKISAAVHVVRNPQPNGKK